MICPDLLQPIDSKMLRGFYTSSHPAYSAHHPNVGLWHDPANEVALLHGRFRTFAFAA